MNSAEQQERSRLEEIKGYLKQMIEYLNTKVFRYKADIKQDIEYYGESRYDMDHIEKMSMRQLINAKKVSADQIVAYKDRLEKVALSPYFGRFDFQIKGEKSVEKIYVGIHNFFHDSEKRPLIYDWRAPISCLFYEHESGRATYHTPTGIIEGDVLLKRQFRIVRGEMEFMIESAINITDDVLQKELSLTSSEGIKNIVATIQRKQNTIIRNVDADVLIIQGVAGSGKTSIALHRIAFLLYRFKDTLTSNDVLIISPNSVFSNYISNILPELGEQSVGEIQMETLANEILEQKYTFQTFFEQTTQLLEQHDLQAQERIKEKSSIEFLKYIQDYAEYLKKQMFVSQDIWIDGYMLPHWLLQEIFQTYRDYSKNDCIREMVDIISTKMENEYHIELELNDKKDLKRKIEKMHTGEPLHIAYKNLFKWIGKPELYNCSYNAPLPYEDVFPMVYLKLQLEKAKIQPRETKHLLIDEMQDYTPIQYAVLSYLFPCRKTILGDVHQSINPYSSTTGKVIADFYCDAIYMELNKSYRSSYEITQFAQSISHNAELTPLERHGDKPKVLACETFENEYLKIIELVKEFKKSKYNTLGIICKTHAKAVEVFERLSDFDITSDLLTAQSKEFHLGIIVCTVHMSKGLEFDQVVVPDVTVENYKTIMDRNLLYVACTRAMHTLTLTHTGARSKYIT